MNRKLVLVAAVAASAIALSARSQELVHFEKGPPVNLVQLASEVPMPVRPRTQQHAAGREVPYAIAPATLDPQPLADPVTKPAIAAPAIAAGFTSDASRVLDPADAGGAVGRQHVVGVSNEGFSIHSRAGAKLLYISLMHFWFIDASLDIYDPRIVYDARGDRWITMAILDERELAIAVSRTGDPTGTWDRWYLPLRGADFSRLALTRDTVMFATHVGDFFDANVYSVDKSALYAAPATLPVRTYAAWVGFVPVHAPDAALEYVVGGFNGRLTVKRLDTIDRPWREVQAGFSVITTPWMSAQKGATRSLDLGFGWIESAVWHDGFIHLVQTALLSSNDGNHTRSGILWWKFDAETGGSVTNGLISEESGKTNRGFASLAVNKAGAMLIAYARVSADEYPSAAFTYVDANGRMSEERTIKTGESAASTFTGRWGDYTGVAIDPVKPLDFWTFQIYGANGKWNTWIANVKGGKARRRAIRH